MSHEALFDKLKKQLERYNGDEQILSLSNQSKEAIRKALPPEYTFQDISRELCRQEDCGNPKRLRALHASLVFDKGLKRVDDEADVPAQRRISNFLARTMAPLIGMPKAEDNDDQSYAVDKEERASILGRCRAMAEDGTAILLTASGEWGLDLSSQVLYTLIAFADETQPWTTPAAAVTARAIIRGEMAKGENKTQSLLDDVLSHLRGLFSKSRPLTITESGRKAEYVAEPDVHSGLEVETPRGKPWKYTDLRSIPLIAWAVDESNTDVLNVQWPRFTPILLTLVDDADTSVRSQGLKILFKFLEKMPGQILVGTGLTRVFEDAVFPTLHYLPSLTPEKESLQLLDPAFAALLVLARCQQSPDEKEKLLDKILRDGIFSGFFHARSHVKIVEVLARQTAVVVQALGLNAVKHLKDLIPMFSEVMTDPFALSYAGTLAATIAALQATLASCWPRMGNTTWQEEVTRMLVVCWLNIREDGKAPEEIEAELVKTAAMLAAVMEAAEVDVPARFDPLVAKEPLLSRLFAKVDSG